MEAGKGISASIDGTACRIGSEKYLSDHGIILDESIKNVGVYTVRCKLGYEVTGSFRLDVQEL